VNFLLDRGILEYKRLSAVKKPSNQTAHGRTIWVEEGGETCLVEYRGF
jgi:hypothetical protein